MSRIIEWSLRFRLLILGIGAASVIVAGIQLPSVPVDVIPEFTPPYVEIQTEALGLSAEEVEELITVPLEADLLNGVAWLDSIQSESVAGLSSIVLVFEPGTDVLRARQVVAERLTQAHALPQVSRPPAMLQPLSSASRVSMVALTSDDLSLIDMSVLARWTIRPRLMGVPGVANVSIWGQRERQLQVLVEPERLRAEGVTLGQIIETTGNALWVSPLSFLDASSPGTGGFIDTPNQRLGVHHVLPITSAEDLARVSLELDDAAEADGPAGLHLGDVATVVEDHQPLIGDATVSDGRGLLLVIEKFPGANTLEVTAGIEAALVALRPGLTGIEFDTTLYRPATFIETAVRNVALTLAVSLALMAGALIVLFRDWRAATVSLVSIVLSLLAASATLVVTGTTINAMVVAGLALAMGIVVDEAIVCVHSITRRLRHPRGGDLHRERLSLIAEQAIASRSGLAYATAAILLGAVPLFFVAGIGGAFVPAVAIAYLTAVLTGTLVGVTVGVALSAVLLRARSPHGSGHQPIAEWMHRVYERIWPHLMTIPRSAALSVAVIAIGVIGLVGLSMFPQIGGAVSPTFKERDVLVQWDAAPGTSGPEMNRILAQASRELRDISGVRNVGGHTGRAILSDQVVGINSAELWVSIDADADYEPTLAEIERVVRGYPGMTPDLQTYATTRIGEVLSDTDDIVVRVYGSDLELLDDKAEELAGLMVGVEGLTDTRVIPLAVEPTIEVEVDLDAAGRLGIKPGDVRRAAATLLSGIEVGSLFQDQKVFEVVVWGAPELRTDLTSVEGLLIDRPDGGHVSLGQVADVRIAPTPTVISRHAVARYVDVTASVSGRDATSVVHDLEQRFAAVSFPLEYRAEILGGALARDADALRLLGIVAAVLVGIFLLFQAAVDSWRLATLACV
ncbi:MAG: efflux RND transporter permease subunit, partial [Chloroflexota bacterium]|nr:efflux RND transporter permease subunit [Chloroflexota bacterium]